MNVLSGTLTRNRKHGIIAKEMNGRKTSQDVKTFYRQSTNKAKAQTTTQKMNGGD